MKAKLILFSILTVSFLGIGKASANAQPLVLTPAQKYLQIVDKNQVVRAALKEARPLGATCEARLESITQQSGSVEIEVQYSCHSENSDGMVKVKGWIYDNEALSDLNIEIRFAG